ncbi:Outer membrane usher protein fimD [Pseudomonas avellanae]|uniref:Outer membrane usher protein fimD n=3 Tax=Pseudomonas avellanae TaxID=46257 RepID=A0A3M5SZ23_9PSED|nr:Outer membrane usher protein fimD [Pseudomonas avellanae]GGJ22398.1 hypothetical protein GCM10009085_15790 [Pseudomonas avellanae]
MEWRKKDNEGAIATLVLPYPRRCVLGLCRCDPLGIGLGLSLMFSVSAFAAPPGTAQGDGSVKFNTAFIQGSDQPPDLQEFLRSNSVLPGTYRVDIYVNRTLSGRRDITFSKNQASGLIVYCFRNKLPITCKLSY